MSGSPWRPVAGVLLLVVAIAAGCGERRELTEVTRIEQVTRTPAMSLPGQNVPARDDTTVVWLATDRARRDVGGQTYIMRADAERMLLLDHPSRTYLDLSFAEASRMLAGLAAQTDTTGEIHPSERLLRGMYRVAAKVTDTGEIDQVLGHRCRRYIVELHLGDTRLTTEQWVTRDYAVDISLLRRASFATLLGLPGATEAMIELARVDGLPVRSTTITELLGRRVRSETELVAVSKSKVPAALFGPPEGYLPIALTHPAAREARP